MDEHGDGRPLGNDALLPQEMALKAEQVGADKARRDGLTLFVFAILAGAFIAFGAVFAATGAAVAVAALDTAEAKGRLGLVDAFFLGVLCNVLVCLAVWMSFSAPTVIGKVVVIVPPISAFVAAGFEHSIANMYYLPVAALILDHAPSDFLISIGAGDSTYRFIGIEHMVHNLVPVTLGNIVVGAVLVGLVYWFIYLRRRG